MEAGQLRIASLASSSKGNSIYIESGNTRLLIDAGVSAKRLMAGLKGLGVEPGSLTAMLITHEHGDHVKGLERFARLHPQVPLLATRGTAQACRKLKVDRIEACLEDGRELKLGDVSLRPFATSHDAAESVGMRFEIAGMSLGLCTDLGCTPFSVREALEGVNLLILEANYDGRMLATGPYPGFLKGRVGGDRGHLSNAQASQLLKHLLHPGLGAVMLAHLSEKNNRPEVALTAVGQALWDEVGVLLGAFPARETSPDLIFAADPSGGRPVCGPAGAEMWRSPWENLFAAF